MNHWGKVSHLLMVAAVFVAGAAPAQAQSAAARYKGDVLANAPSEAAIQQDIANLASALLPEILQQQQQEQQQEQQQLPSVPPAVAAPPPPSNPNPPANSIAAPTNMEQLMLMLTGGEGSGLELVDVDVMTIAAFLQTLGVQSDVTSQLQWLPLDMELDIIENYVLYNPGSLVLAAMQATPVNLNATTLAAWAELLANSPHTGKSPVWADVLPTVLSGYYTGSAVAAMPNGASSRGDLTLQVDFTTRDVEGAMSFYSANPDLAGDIEFAGNAEIGGAKHALAGTMLYSGAFGGVIEDGTWSGEFHGSMADMVTGDWQATVDGGPNAGVVHGKFGGDR